MSVGPRSERRAVQCAAEYCKKDISNEVCIECAECSNLQLCLHCFSVGHEQGAHLNTHSYRVIDNMKFPLTEPGWGADEELRLLDIIETVGIGNWVAVSKQLGSKSPEDCEQHYVNHYLQGPSAPLPNILDPTQLLTGGELDGAGPAATAETPPQDETSTGGASAHRRKKGGRKTASKGKDTKSSSKQQTVNEPPLTLPPAALGYEYAGYYPKREDFEQEYQEGCESLMAQLTFYPDDTPLDVRLKIAMLRIYNAKLNRRQQRKGFCISRGMVSNQKIQQYSQNSEFRAVFNRLRPLLRFHPADQLHKLLDALYEKSVLVQKMRQWLEYRRVGLTRRTDVPVYLANRRKRAASKDARRGSVSASAGRGRSAVNGARKGSVSASNGSTGRSGGGSSSEGLMPSAEFMVLPSAGILSPMEQDLCVELGMVPSQYFAIKAALLLEAERKGTLSLEQVSAISRLSPERATLIYALMGTSGWIPLPPVERALLDSLPTHGSDDTPDVTAAPAVAAAAEAAPAVAAAVEAASAAVAAATEGLAVPALVVPVATTMATEQ